MYELLTDVWLSSVDLIEDEELEETKAQGVQYFVLKRYAKKAGKNSAIPEKSFKDLKKNLKESIQGNHKNYVLSKQVFFQLTYQSVVQRLEEESHD